MVILIKIMYITLVGIMEKIRLGIIVKLVLKALNFERLISYKYRIIRYYSMKYT